MKKLFYLYLDNAPKEVLNTYLETEAAIRRGDCVILTTSLANISFDLIDEGYTLYVCTGTKCIELKPGMTTDTGKEVRKEHNIEKMIKGHDFDKNLCVNH